MLTVKRLVDTFRFNTARFAHSFAAGPSPNLEKLRAAVHQHLSPIAFDVQNDYTFGNHVYDRHFKGYLCSPLFEGKTYPEINEMVENVLKGIEMEGSCKFHCQPPSRWLKMKRLTRKRLSMEK
eukprot:GDKJ01003890.1.p1 GENE.GDKJ01003890.1~~GDKJ01003890.1.p1  ORF type:complete len:123 (-),score=18.68 GDKJ01003890.1:55-423(-)